MPFEIQLVPNDRNVVHGVYGLDRVNVKNDPIQQFIEITWGAFFLTIIKTEGLLMILRMQVNEIFDLK